MIRNSLIMVRCSTPALLQLPFPRGRGHRDHFDGCWRTDEGRGVTDEPIINCSHLS